VCSWQVVAEAPLQCLELAVKLPLKVYEQLGVALQSSRSLEILSLAGSCCGDAAVGVSLS